MTLPDANTRTSVFDLVLSVGQNVVKVKVKVTAEDVTTTETYTLRIRRAATDELISNLGQGTLPSESVSTTIPKIAAQFTTGSNPGGYNISAVKLKLSMPSGTTPRISIYSNKVNDTTQFN